MKRTRIKQRSADKATWHALYMREKARRLLRILRCQRCNKTRPHDGHHPYGQAGENIMVFVLLCRRCHDLLHAGTVLAKAQGWIVDTLKKTFVEHPAVKAAREWWEQHKTKTLHP